MTWWGWLWVRLRVGVWMQPCFVWKQAGDPYHDWLHIDVASCTGWDACGCVLQRFKQYCETTPGRWGMWYELLPHGTRARWRGPRQFAFKLYVNRETQPKADVVYEVSWFARPCADHGPLKTVSEYAANGYRNPTTIREGL